MHELAITRVLDAPISLVWRAWTEREHLLRWFCPKDFLVLFAESDLRPGGRWRSGMRGPGGDEYVAGGVYREIEPTSHLAFTHCWEPDGSDTLATVRLEPVGERTRMTFIQSGLPTSESRDSHAEGWNEAFYKLTTTLREIHAVHA